MICPTGMYEEAEGDFGMTKNLLTSWLANIRCTKY